MLDDELRPPDREFGDSNRFAHHLDSTSLTPHSYLSTSLLHLDDFDMVFY
jgi:hypothetical protein